MIEIKIGGERHINKSVKALNDLENANNGNTFVSVTSGKLMRGNLMFRLSLKAELFISFLKFKSGAFGDHSTSYLFGLTMTHIL